MDASKMHLFKLWLSFIICIVVSILFIIAEYPQYLVPQAKGLTGHYYVMDDWGDGRTYMRRWDLSASHRELDAIDISQPGTTVKDWDINQSNTCLVVIYDSHDISVYDITDGSIVVKRPSQTKFVDKDGFSINGFDVNSDGTSLTVTYEYTPTERSHEPSSLYDMEIINLSTGAHNKTNWKLQSVNYTIDRKGETLAQCNKWGHLTVEHLPSHRREILDLTCINAIISPDGKSVYCDDNPTSYVYSIPNRKVTKVSDGLGLMNWAPDSRGYTYTREVFPLTSRYFYYDIASQRSYRFPIQQSGKWVD